MSFGHHISLLLILNFSYFLCCFGFFHFYIVLEWKLWLKFSHDYENEKVLYIFFLFFWILLLFFRFYEYFPEVLWKNTWVNENDKKPKLFPLDIPFPLGKKREKTSSLWFQFWEKKGKLLTPKRKEKYWGHWPVGKELSCFLWWKILVELGLFFQEIILYY